MTEKSMQEKLLEVNKWIDTCSEDLWQQAEENLKTAEQEYQNRKNRRTKD
ncbi:MULTISPECIES: hypothetical protein [Paenibacillus]|uniref:Uncharacterized protein n=1 Tax=Paenibacillus glycanilyticus TaxID=126569 RepID=A0ABQ6NSI8_9BACL|nr:hypothetical protein [Paenibacillus glycanilyticus]GMK47500.1 hypothetical protein PghCCS26_46300 [Paenibacillus glycanilyticus]